MNSLSKFLLMCFIIVIVVTIDGAYIAYDESSDSVITTTPNGVDAALQEAPASTGQVIIISQRRSFQILYNFLIIPNCLYL